MKQLVVIFKAKGKPVLLSMATSHIYISFSNPTTQLAHLQKILYLSLPGHPFLRYISLYFSGSTVFVVCTKYFYTDRLETRTDDS